MGAARHWLLIRLRPCFVGPARVDSRKQSQIRDGGRRRIPDAQTRARRPLPLHPAGRIANPNAPASRASAGGASSRLPASTLRVSSQIRTPPHHPSALEGQAPACPPKDPRRPNTGKEALAPPPCGSHRKSERHRPRASAGGASSRLPAEGSPTPKPGQGGPCPSTLQVASQIRTPPPTRQRWRGKLPLARIHPAGRPANPNATAHPSALEAQAPACPPKDPRRPNTGKEDLAPPPCRSPRESERHRITRQRWRGKLPLARIHPAGRIANPNAPASRASAGGASSRLPAEESTTPKHAQGRPPRRTQGFMNTESIAANPLPTLKAAAWPPSGPLLFRVFP
jgi:hypothetical protein